MPMSIEDVARRYANRPGCRLIGYESVGLCVFAMNLRVIAVEETEVPPIDEFLLRLLDLGVAEPSRMAGFLGLEQRLTNTRLVELQRAELINVLPLDSGGEPKCSLTRKGKNAASSLSQSRLKEINVGPVIFHGFLRQPIAMGDDVRAQLLRPAELRDLGMTPIRAIPQRKPFPEEIDLDALSAVVDASRKRSRKSTSLQLLNVRSVGKRSSTHFQPAVMLIYETTGLKKQRQIAFAVGGVVEESYEHAFVEKRGPELLKDVVEARFETTEDLVERYMRPETSRQLPKPSKIDKASDELDSAEQNVRDAQVALEKGRPDTRVVLKQELEESQKELEQAQARIDQLKARRLHLYSCTDVLNDALREANHRLVIVSAFISSDVIDKGFEEKLTAVLDRGVQVWIQYGMGDEQKEQRHSWAVAERVLKGIARAYPEQVRIDSKGKTHEKILICDNQFVAVGSFNWLSYPGASARHRRKESAIQLFDPDQVEEWFQFVASRFKD